MSRDPIEIISKKDRKKIIYYQTEASSEIFADGVASFGIGANVFKISFFSQQMNDKKDGSSHREIVNTIVMPKDQLENFVNILTDMSKRQADREKTL